MANVPQAFGIFSTRRQQLYRALASRLVQRILIELVIPDQVAARRKLRDEFVRDFAFIDVHRFGPPGDEALEFIENPVEFISFAHAASRPTVADALRLAVAAHRERLAVDEPTPAPATLFDERPLQAPQQLLNSCAAEATTHG